MSLKETVAKAREAITYLSAREAELLEKVAALETKLNTLEKAEQLVFNHLNKGYFSAETLFEKLSEYKNSSLEELHILEKAAALVDSKTSSFGSLSEKTASGGSGNALLDCILED